MRAVVQRVSAASVTVDAVVRGQIGPGLLVYLGVEKDDGDADVTFLADKVAHLRIFSDEQDKLNLDIAQSGAQVLVISAFTVCADARRGRRPSFDGAASHEHAGLFYERFCQELDRIGVHVEKGVFRATMNVSSVNAGPVCILLDSRRHF